VPEDWVAKFKGKFDQGWDKVREDTFKKQVELGILPPNSKLPPRSPGFPAWDSLRAEEKAVYTRQIEVRPRDGGWHLIEERRARSHAV
jgi:arylsulfatase A-like enzyme